jgi:diguanylate cyclase (GGDEF)-like protein/PAS domain S-box-containing protein
VNDRQPLPSIALSAADSAKAAAPAEAPPASYAGRTRYTQLEYEAVLANASIGIAFTRDRKFFLCNPKFAEMFGWAPGELIGRPGETVYPSRESYAALGQIAVPVLSAGRQLDLEWEMRRKDGSTFLCRMIAKAIDPANTPQGTVWIVEDITEQRRNADEASRLLREQQAILDTASIGISFARDRAIVRINRRFGEMYGYSEAELVGRPSRLLFVEEKDHVAAGEAYAQLARGQVYRQVSARRRKDGSIFWVRATGRLVDPTAPEKGAVWLDEDITEERRAEAELQRVLGEQQALLGNVVVGIAIVRERRIVRCNRRMEELFGYAPGELTGEHARVVYFTEEEAARGGDTYAELDAGRVHQREQWLRRKDGSGFWCRLSGQAVEAGNPAKGYVWLFDDVSQRRRDAERIQEVLAEQQLLLDNATVGIAFVRERRIQRCNPRMEEMFGYAAGELAGRPSAELYLSEADYLAARAARLPVLAAGGSHVEERQLRRRDGSLFWCKLVGREMKPGHPGEGSIWIFDDVSAEHGVRESLQASRDALERAVAARTAQLRAANARLEAEIADRMQAEQRAQHLAGHDALTGLPNRRLLEDRLTQALAQSDRNRKHTAVMFVDLDRFKAINDSLGHAAGDELLKEMARRLVAQLRVGDTVCRIGGDEFVVVLPELKRASDAVHVAQKIIEQLVAPLRLGSEEVAITSSVGISVFPEDGRDAETLIRNADAAMYHAKEMGRANYQFFTEQTNQAASRRLALESDLRRALDAGELRVLFQPIVEAASGALAGHEALVRWQHATKGLVPPAEFIQLAEDTGLILRVGDWVLNEACRWAARAGPQAGQVTVNLSARQLNDPRLAERVAQALEASGLAAKRLVLDVPEAVAMQQSDATLGVLRKLREIGVSTAIDDFGAAQSSLAQLRRFRLDTLKIDRSLVAGVPGDAERSAVVAASIALAKALGIAVLAKGVETPAQREFLLAQGCELIQGFLLGAPAEADAAAKQQR